MYSTTMTSLLTHKVVRKHTYMELKADDDRLVCSAAERPLFTSETSLGKLMNQENS